MANNPELGKKITEKENVAVIGDLDPARVGPIGAFYAYDNLRRAYLIQRLIEKISARKTALDLGCGRGHFASMFRELGFDECHGVDISPERATFARDRGFSMVTLSRGQALPFEDGYFDFVLCHAVLVHVIQPEDRAELIAEISRVVRRGGILVLSYPTVAGRRLIKFMNLITLTSLGKWIKDKFDPPYKLKANPSEYCRYYTPLYIDNLLTECGFQPMTTLGHLYLWPEILSRFVPVLKGLDRLLYKILPNMAGYTYMSAVRR